MSMSAEEIAQVCHSANMAYSKVTSTTTANSVPWSHLKPEIQRNVIKGVEYAIANPLALPEDMHEKWRETCDPDHECNVPYDELPPNQQVKDRLFSVITQILSSPGVQ